MKPALLSLALLASLASGAHAPAAPDTCAKRLNIHYNQEDGATERLYAFEACVGH